MKNQKVPTKLTEPIELNSLRKFLIDAVKDENVVDGHKLKMLIGVTFGIMGDTLEMQQLHELQLAYDKQFTALQVSQDKIMHDLMDEITEVKRDTKFKIRIVQAGIIMLGAIFTGVASLPELIRFFGLG